jgi:nucleoside-diphosphate-sugar epimerase
MQTAGKIAVAGATGRVGRHLVEVLTDRGHEVVPVSRTHGVNIISGEGLAEALVEHRPSEGRLRHRESHSRTRDAVWPIPARAL